jgi:uncharacterized hydrophobic protein (TIGR00271 family)
VATIVPEGEFAMEIQNLKKTLRGFFNISEGRARYKTIRKRIVEDARIDGIHVCQLIAAMLIASIGLNVDSTEAVIGAMLICPLMGSVLAIAYAIATIDHRYLRESLLGLFMQVVVCLLTSTLYFVLSPLSNTTSELLTNSSATVWDVLIAFVGGFAGALGTSRRQEPTTLVAGVAVATALMPPLCATGFGVACNDWGSALSAFYEFLINVVFIAFGAEIVLVALRLPLQRDINGDGVITDEEVMESEEESRRMRTRLIVGSIVFALPCLFFSARVISSTMDASGTLFEAYDEFDAEITTMELRVVCPGLEEYRVGRLNTYDVDSKQLVEEVVATVETSEELDKTQRAEVEGLVRLHVPDVDAVTFEVAGK